ncbi:hypothetical protein TNCV_4649661 [Trichonephila clavipes]|uniref:Uncharacterized protein n=1 Tax=Trichonephila clavipes TaxID=2585209 RepID=A0A8X6SUR1_TRICX|nr:hypothetical protein TNCV_4649661 [Trichonephila clavipes]
MFWHFQTTRNEVTSTTDQHYKGPETSSRARGYEITPLRVKGDIEDVYSELDMGVKDCTSWMERPEFYCSRHVKHLTKPVQDL